MCEKYEMDGICSMYLVWGNVVERENWGDLEADEDYIEINLLKYSSLCPTIVGNKRFHVGINGIA
jgi:hypothetical protein